MAEMSERSVPRERVEVDRIDQRSIDVKDYGTWHGTSVGLIDLQAAYQRRLLGQSGLACAKHSKFYADAHHNLAILLEKRGDRRGLIRHLNAYRRLSS
jgi:hypothetical protein